MKMEYGKNMKYIQGSNTEYNRYSRFWERIEPKIQSDFLARPYVIKLAGDVKNKRIIDIGCGEGYIARILAKKGAKVVGIDSSREMIKIAKKLSEKLNLNIEYRVGNALNLKNLFKRKFDIALSVLVFPYFNKINLSRAVKQVSFLLKRKGKFIIATTHPFLFAVKPKTRWVKFYRDDFNYFTSTKSKVTLFDKDLMSFTTEVYHNTFEHIINVLLKNKFQLIKILEPKPTKKDLKKFPTMWVEETRYPFYLIIVAEKV
jgi:ubiquinone/menaquinone biosynthesis C-methylase UbiE